MTSRRALVWWCAGFLLLAPGCATQRISVPLVPPLIAAPKSPLVWSESFDALDRERWREVEIKHRTEYQAVTLDGRRCLQARSQGGASILLSPVRFNPETAQWLSWEWRVDQLVHGEALERKNGSDAAARVYVYFEAAGLPWQKRSLDYVWSASLPVGTILNSAYSTESKIIVVESGDDALGQWRAEARNLEEDYQRCFGGRLPDVIAIGLMSDADNTDGATLAYFDDLHIRRLPRGAKPADGSSARQQR